MHVSISWIQASQSRTLASLCLAHNSNTIDVVKSTTTDNKVAEIKRAQGPGADIYLNNENLPGISDTKIEYSNSRSKPL